VTDKVIALSGTAGHGRLGMAAADRSRVMRRIASKATSLVIFVALLTFILLSHTPLRDMRWGVIPAYHDFLIRSLAMSWIVTLVSFLLSTPAAIILAFGRLSRHRWLRYPSMAVVEGVRIIPELMIIFWIFFTAPVVIGQSLDKFTSGIIALGVINAAYLTEAIRAGIQSVPSGLSLAGLGSGLKKWQVRLWIVLPIALWNMLPELRNRIISLFKLTSLLYLIGVREFFGALININNREFAPFATMIIAGVVYFACAYVFEVCSRFLEPRHTG